MYSLLAIKKYISLPNFTTQEMTLSQMFRQLFNCHAGIVHLIKFKLVSFKLAPSLNIAHFRISVRVTNP